MGTFYDSPNDYRNYLAHYGVKGMHWGVRKADAYDHVYYRQKYNNKKIQAFKDRKSKKISGAKFVGKRIGNMAGHYLLDPWKIAGRDIGRNVRGWYRLLTGKTYRKTNEQEFTPAQNRAMSQISNKKDRDTIKKMVQESLSNTTISVSSNGAVYNLPDYNAIMDYLDNVTLSEIDKINKEK